MGKRALIMAGKLLQDHEYIYPYYRLPEDGYEVDVAVRGKETVLGSIGVKIVPTKDIPELKVEDYDILVLPGGAKAMEYMRQDEEILKFIADFHAAGKVIFVICHGTQLLISAGVVKGKKMSGYYSIKDDINNAGGTYVDAPYVIDGGVVSCPHYKYLGAWMKAGIAHAEGR
ncbi:MAG TPA: DJ-1/PfpI/YhbO family deglycase/protease [Nitrospirales bacterium]|nr:DJ-1/PfpI/YhbO family deglycase/protease [Nitrospirales bacterium]HIB54568.1 DJ-1/PfpI/YhbO family deglycase/protease [Nitrospirales bacterium]HIC05238.1 DJ-1/PfpI/YhbO family deglycase/protease [Nitrospirales bacterium]HIN33700.1 DJ-1/PfpI/YhbO family deglycase/protease [Nitrospirales bacterium]HIO21151.1 DJ-1/PfpI/YhbO family deglycase/protease [Nitrospirales bacterium]